MIILLRHGEAGYDAPTDELRELTERGIRFVRHQATAYAKQMQQIDKVICSPYTRTQQTAKLVRDTLPELPFELDARWVPEAPLQEAIASLEEHAEQNILVVTHQPLIGNLIAYLVDGNLQQPANLMPGELVVLDTEWPAAGTAIRRPV